MVTALAIPLTSVPTADVPMAEAPSRSVPMRRVPSRSVPFRNISLTSATTPDHDELKTKSDGITQESDILPTFGKLKTPDPSPNQRKQAKASVGRLHYCLSGDEAIAKVVAKRKGRPRWPKKRNKRTDEKKWGRNES